MKDNDIKQAILEVEEIKLKAQLRAVRETLKGDTSFRKEDGEERKSQVEYVYMVLKDIKKPLHVSEIVSKAKEMFGIELYRESIVSALLKKVHRFDRFSKTGKNTFGLIEYRDLYRSQPEEE
ncbi:MAG: hypothetical protein Q8M98_09990 [Candidatus Cloacimonadaceae bacterium]|nr:hypothetical protein [Candidatus Cloacimonadaceae bacterium]MDP3115085.1 hypothetical protein [Candidatus Cloacimonadaceae bacterium]